MQNSKSLMQQPESIQANTSHSNLPVDLGGVGCVKTNDPLSSPSPLPLAWVKRIFQRLEIVYGDKFKNQYADQAKIDLAQIEWANALKGVPAHTIKAALDQAASGVYMIPQTFLAFCLRVGGVPTAQEGLRLAKLGDTGHPAVKLTYDRIGSYAFKSLNENALMIKWSSVYASVIEEINRKNMGGIKPKLQNGNIQESINKNDKLCLNELDDKGHLEQKKELDASVKEIIAATAAKDAAVKSWAMNRGTRPRCELWSKCLAHLKENIAANEYLTWVLPLQAKIDEGLLVLLAPNNFVYEKVSEDYLDLIITYLREEGGSIKVAVIRIGSL